MSEARESDFNGKPVLGIYKDDKDQNGFKFGLWKARLILNHIEHIRLFVEKYDKQPVKAAA